LEDLEGKIDLVLFPRTWLACRENVAVDQVMLVTGKVQVKRDDINLIVDRVETNLEIAQDGDATRQVPKSGKAVRKTAVPTQPKNGNGHASPPPPPEPAPAFTPPEKATVAETAVSINSQSPPPPPNFDDDSEAQPIVQPANARPKVQAQENGSDTPTAKTPLVSPAPTRQTNSIRKTVVVEIRPVGNWQEACRRALNKLNEYEGEDGLTIMISGQNLKMDFPNGRTRSCPDLLETLRTIPGIAKVYNG
jgi:DNA polymerase-3 subunit alpha